MNPILIIGYGNPLRSDDGIGWHAVQALINEWPSEQVCLESAHQLLPEMAAWIAEAGVVFFIDASRELLPGQVASSPVKPEKTRTASMTHHFSPQGLLADAQRLYQRSPQTVTVAIGGSSFELGNTLSPVVSAALPDLLARVRKLVGDAIAGVAQGAGAARA